MSNTRKLRDVAEDDQADAAAAQIIAAIRAIPGAEEAAADGRSDPLYRRAYAALDAALDPAHPGRRCPHIGPIRPYVLDPYRGLLSCGWCRREDQFVPLGGDEEFRCDRCAAMVDPADFCTVLLVLAEFITAGVMVCPPCHDAYTGRQR